MARVPFADLTAEHAPLRGAIDRAIGNVLDSSRFILGPEVDRFEQAVAHFSGAMHAVGVSSGTDALVVALAALGVGKGDLVITTPFTFFASAEAILRVGARPHFVDVDPESLCLDADRVGSELAPGTRAILPVHLYGSMQGIDALSALGRRHGVPIVEDAAQAFGSSLSGRAAGAWGAVGCFSFFPAKVLGAVGDAGLVTTADPAIAERCRSLRQHGSRQGAYSSLGGNFRLDAIQAAVLSVKLPYVTEWVRQRREHGAAYDEAFTGVAGLAPVKRGADWNGGVYTLRVLDGRRDHLQRHLAESGVETAVYYRRPLHWEPPLAELGFRQGEFPESERAAAEVLSLPLYPSMTEAQRGFVIETVLAALA